MPYIPRKARSEINAAVDELTAILITPGEYNYALTKFCQEFLEWLTNDSNDVCYRGGYDARASVIALLECVKLEFYRRDMAAYEDEKCEQNGDVY